MFPPHPRSRPSVLPPLSLLGLAVLCNGGSYQNAPPKFIAMACFLPAVCGLLMVNHVRYALPYGYALSVAKFSTPIIALSGNFANVLGSV